MDTKVIVILGLAGLMFFLSIIMGIVAWVNSGDDESTDDSTTGGSTTGTSGGTTDGGSSDEETCERPEIHCIGNINWGDSVHHGKDCSEARPGDLTGLTAEDELGFFWIEKAYQAGSNHKLVVKDRYGEVCEDKEVICKGDEVNWPDSIYKGQDCSAHAIDVNGNNDKSLESYDALNWCRRAEETISAAQ